MPEVSKILRGTRYYELDPYLLEYCEYSNYWHDEFLFVKANYMLTKFPSHSSSFSSQISRAPIDIKYQYGYLFLLDVEQLIGVVEYNNLLVEIFLKSNNFDAVNIIFNAIYPRKDFTADQVRIILQHCLSGNRNIRGAFDVRRYLLDLILNNRTNVSYDQFINVVNQFPLRHAFGGPSEFRPKEN